MDASSGRFLLIAELNGDTWSAIYTIRVNYHTINIRSKIKER